MTSRPITSPDNAEQRTEISQRSDLSLVVGVVRRNPAALAEAFERYSADCHALAVVLAGEILASMVVQQVFAELWTKAPTLTATPTDLRSHLLDRTTVWSGGGRTRDAVAPLSADQRDAILEARRSGVTYHEVARKLQRSPARVRRDIRAGLALLRRHLASAEETSTSS